MSQFAVEIDASIRPAYLSKKYCVIEARDHAEATKLVQERLGLTTDQTDLLYTKVLGTFLDQEIAHHSNHLGRKIRAKQDNESAESYAYFEGSIRERVTACRHLASLLGTSAQESLNNNFERIAHPEASYQITGSDSCPFSFSFTMCGSIYGALIFHSHTRTWSCHT